MKWTTEIPEISGWYWIKVNIYGQYLTLHLEGSNETIVYLDIDGPKDDWSIIQIDSDCIFSIYDTHRGYSILDDILFWSDKALECPDGVI